MDGVKSLPKSTQVVDHAFPASPMQNGLRSRFSDSTVGTSIIASGVITALPSPSLAQFTEYDAPANGCKPKRQPLSSSSISNRDSFVDLDSDSGSDSCSPTSDSHSGTLSGPSTPKLIAVSNVEDELNAEKRRASVASDETLGIDLQVR